MSETRWRARGNGVWLWLVPTGRHEVKKVESGFGLCTNGNYQHLQARDVVSAFREAERIIADRCRDTLELLGGIA